MADAATGLVWQGCAAGQTGLSCSGTEADFNWQAALDYCQDSTWAGFADWYLPNVDELRSIVDDSRVLPSIDVAAFPATPSRTFWSSSSYAGGVFGAWNVRFSSGHVDYTGKTYASYVRCVRRGP